MLRYDEPALLHSLASLAPKDRVAFAVACAERLRPYFGYPDSPPIPKQLDEALEALRRAVEESLPANALNSVVSICETTLDPDDDAVAAISYASAATLPDGTPAAAWAARRAYEARDRLVGDTLDGAVFTPEVEQRILAHPAVQAELHHQAVDLELLSTPGDHGHTVLQRARKVATGRAAI
jgi:hypothetical protein